MTTAQPSTRERRAARTRQAILDAAREIITERGAYGLSLREIARRIEYSPAGLYEYFGSKEEIVQAVIADGFQRFADYLFSVSTDLPAQEYLHELGMSYIRFAVNKPQHFLFIFSRPELQDAQQAVDHYVARSDEPPEAVSTFDVLVAGIQRAIDEGVYPPTLDVMATSFTNWSMVHGVAMLLVTQLKQHTLAQNWEPIADKTLRDLFVGLHANAWAAEHANSAEVT